MYLAHFYSIQHELLIMQERWKSEEKQQESRGKDITGKLQSETEAKRTTENSKSAHISKDTKTQTNLPTQDP